MGFFCSSCRIATATLLQHLCGAAQQVSATNLHVTTDGHIELIMPIQSAECVLAAQNMLLCCAVGARAQDLHAIASTPLLTRPTQSAVYACSQILRN
jgi:hypothetical protein